MVHHLKQCVITVAKDSIVEFHDRATPQVRMPILFLVVHNIRKDFIEQGREVLRRLGAFSRIFRLVFQNRPQIDERTPVDIAQVRQE